jgi:hypothetical protein
MVDREAIRLRWEADGSKRAVVCGWLGWLTAVSEITGIARSIIGRELRDLVGQSLPSGQVRR